MAQSVAVCCFWTWRLKKTTRKTPAKSTFIKKHNKKLLTKTTQKLIMKKSNGNVWSWLAMKKINFVLNFYKKLVKLDFLENMWNMFNILSRKNVKFANFSYFLFYGNFSNWLFFFNIHNWPKSVFHFWHKNIFLKP